jgi:hypothetical protein
MFDGEPAMKKLGERLREGAQKSIKESVRHRRASVHGEIESDEGERRHERKEHASAEVLPVYRPKSKKPLSGGRGASKNGEV